MSLDHLGGWFHDPEEVDRQLATLPRPLFARAAPRISGSGAGKTTLLYTAFKEVNHGTYIDYPAQTIGDCVSHGFGHGVDLLEAVQIALGHKRDLFHQTATEAIYGLARVDVGGQRGSYSDGAVGAWAAKAVSTIGTVDRDLVGPYDGNRAKTWGAKGIPSTLREKAGKHKVQSVSLVATYEELEDALANGYPVPVCSNQGFTLVRDDDGFCRPHGTWGHCMLIVGVRADDRPGACIFQSWGSEMPSGPRALDQPPNSVLGRPRDGRLDALHARFVGPLPVRGLSRPDDPQSLVLFAVRLKGPTMLCLFAATLVGSWTYSGFLCEPTAPPPPTPPQALGKVTPAIEPVPAQVALPAAPQPKKVEPAIPKTSADSVSIVPRSSLFRSTDASGQSWEHPDSAYLSSFIEARNRSLGSTFYSSTQPFRASWCVNGRCN